MGSHFFIGVDIGTQGTKACLVNEAGRILSEHFVPLPPDHSKPELIEVDPRKQYESVVTSMKKVLSSSRVDRISAIGITGQTAGIIGIDRSGNHVTPYDSWLDGRCAPYAASMKKTALIPITRKAGCPPGFNHGSKILWWKHKRPRTYRAIQSFVQPSGYVTLKLCGLNASHSFMDRTYLHFSGFANTTRGIWDSGLCAKFGVDPRKLPRIVNCTDIIGEITPAVRKQLGIKNHALVIAACGDTQASFLSCGLVKPGICIDVAGTASVFGASIPSFSPDIKKFTLAVSASPQPDLFYSYAYLNGGGINLEWFLQEIANRKRSSNRFTLQALDALAHQIRKTKDLPLFSPHLGGRACPNQTSFRGSWFGLRWNHSLEHLYLAILESVALEYASYRSILQTLHPSLKLREIRTTGGGEKSKAWNQIKASVLGLPVSQVIQNGGAPFGCAMIASVSAGVFQNLKDCSQAWVKTKTLSQPEASMASHYQTRIRMYQEWISSQEKLCSQFYET